MLLVLRNRFFRLILLGVPLAVLTACGDGFHTPPGPLAAFENQSLPWKTCDPLSFGPEHQDWFEAVDFRARCAVMRAPRDYARPNAGEIAIQLVMIPAGEPRQRQGAILLNPGGPGADGASLPFIIGLPWIQADPADPIGALYRQIAQRYDLVGFDPRGTGASTRLACADEVALRFIANPARDRSPENTANMLYNSRAIAEACQDDPLLPHINSDATARDMDLLRHLLGDERLNYIGISYGTWLGNWYASLFPGRVGRMLLNAMMDVTQPMNSQNLPQEGRWQGVLDEVVLPYASRHPQRFLLGEQPQAIRQRLDRLSSPLHAALVSSLKVAVSRSSEVDRGLLAIRAADVIQGELDLDPAIAEQALRARLEGYAWVPDPALKAVAEEEASKLITAYFQQVHEEVPTFPPPAYGSTMHWAVVYNDSGTPYTPDTWIAASTDNAWRYPEFGGFWRQNPTLYWHFPLVTRPPQELAALAGPLLVLQTEGDPMTDLAGARNSLVVLPNARLIEIRGDYTHGPTVPYGTDCVDRPIAEYFLYGTLPPAETPCPGLPLAADTEGRQ